MNTFQMGFGLICAFLFWTKQILGQPCYTPEKQRGYCFPLIQCPEILETFANPPIGSETYLRRFLCNEDGKQLKVCCVIEDRFTLFKDDSILAATLPDISQHHAFNYCAQHSVSNIDLPVILRKSGDANEEDKRCLGILANPRYVITPAQCVVPNTQGKQFTVVGVKFRGKNNNSPTFGVEEVISHPFFDPPTGINDIALLRLNQTVSEDSIPALCKGYLSYELYRIMFEARVWTYSNLDLSTIERELNKSMVNITLLSVEECERDFLENDGFVVLTKYDFCAKNVINVTKFTCNEFTGVPLFLEHHGIAYVGFSSSRTVCNDDLPVIYTNVGQYTRWLRDQMKPWPIKNDPCTTPDGEIGECWYLSYCPALWDTFSSVTNATEAYLRGFICEGSSVCCATSSNSTIVLKKDEPKLDDVPIQFLETRLCGWQHRDDYFSKSADTAIDEFPWLALIKTGPQRHPCEGVLINLRYVLSIGFCVPGDIDTTIVRLGDFNQQNETSCVKDPVIGEIDCTETEKYGIEKIIRHPFFMLGFPLGDIVLLRLNKTVEYTDYIRPICLPIPGTVTPKVGDTMYMSSWGRRNEYSKRGIKKKVWMQLMNEEECQREFPFFHIKHLNRICTLNYQNNTDFADNLDKGAPLMFSNNYQWYIAGLVLNITEKNLPTIHVNVSKYINWIIESMEPWQSWDDYRKKGIDY